MITKPTIYTEEFVLKELNDLMTELIEDKEIYLLGELFETRAYHSSRYAEWKIKFKEHREILGAIKRIKNILEHRLNKRGLDGKSNPAMTIFNLKNNYDWTDKTEVDVNAKHSMDKATDEEIDNKITEKMNKLNAGD